MKYDDLPPETRQPLDVLIEAVEQALNADDSPHTRAVAYGWIEDPKDPHATLSGGGIDAPGRPEFDYDERNVRKLYRAALDSSDRLLHTIVIHAERATDQDPWKLGPVKLVSRKEHDAILAERAVIDDQVRAELEPLAKGARWAGFGRNNIGKPVRLVRGDAQGLTDLPITDRLLNLLQQTEAIYRKAGLDLLIIDWSLEGSELDVREYFE